jgi:hypothetical protein
MREISERDGNGRRGELKPLRLVKGHAGSTPAVRTNRMTDQELRAVEALLRCLNPGQDVRLSQDQTARLLNRLAAAEMASIERRSERGVEEQDDGK